MGGTFSEGAGKAFVSGGVVVSVVEPEPGKGGKAGEEEAVVLVCGGTGAVP
jgi:hypothetical protein